LVGPSAKLLSALFRNEEITAPEILSLGMLWERYPDNETLFEVMSHSGKIRDRIEAE